MDRPEEEKGAVILRTLFGEVAVATFFPDVPLEDMTQDQDWREAAGVEGGPFCYTDAERDIPF